MTPFAKNGIKHVKSGQAFVLGKDQQYKNQTKVYTFYSTAMTVPCYCWFSYKRGK